jgi:hypothetical protein
MGVVAGIELTGDCAILERLARVDPNLSRSEDAEGLLLAVAGTDVHPA